MRVAAGVVGLVVVGAGVAHASGLTATGSALGSGSAAVSACGSLAGVGHTVDVSGGAVVSVTVTGLPSTCNGADLSLTLTSAGTAQGGGGPVVVANGSATVTVSPAVPTGAFDDLRLVVVGP